MNAEPQLPLVDARTLAHTRDPASSIDAARSNQAGKVSGRLSILRSHASNPDGLTDDEASALTGIEIHETRRRCTDLRNTGLIKFVVDYYEPGRFISRPVFISRPSNTGRRSTVSVITTAGHRTLR